MLKVRRSLTEILLEVTNEEIATVCREIWSRARAKGTQDKSDHVTRKSLAIIFLQQMYSAKLLCTLKTLIHFAKFNLSGAIFQIYQTLVPLFSLLFCIIYFSNRSIVIEK